MPSCCLVFLGGLLSWLASFLCRPPSAHFFRRGFSLRGAKGAAMLLRRGDGSRRCVGGDTPGRSPQAQAYVREAGEVTVGLVVTGVSVKGRLAGRVASVRMERPTTDSQ
jgi:hypothetical protein